LSRIDSSFIDAEKFLHVTRSAMRNPSDRQPFYRLNPEDDIMASPKITGFASAVALAAFSCAPAIAETDAQREACMPDAFRLCAQFIPDAGRVENCLRNAGPRLSPACYVVFNPPNATPVVPRTAHMQPRSWDEDAN
jgi:hypothetical protein